MSTTVDEALESASWDLEPLVGGRGAEGVEEMLAEARGAVTDDEEARIATTGVADSRRVKVSPHSYHFVGRALQEFGPSASTANPSGSS